MNAHGAALTQWRLSPQLVALGAPAGRAGCHGGGRGIGHPRSRKLLKWLGEPWADVLISAAGLEWLETPAGSLNFLEAD